MDTVNDNTKPSLDAPKDRIALLNDAVMALYDIHHEVQQSDYNGHNFIARAFEVLSKFAGELESLNVRP